MQKTALWLTVIGGLNWGLVGLGMLVGVEGGWNVVEMLLGSWSVVEAIVYVLVGISAVVLALGGAKKSAPAMDSSMNTGSEM